MIAQSRDWIAEAAAIAESAHEWAERFRTAPFVNNNGMAPDTAFYLYYWVREISPKLIVESGTWRGFSTWVMREAAPAAKIISLDPIFALGHCLDSAKIGSGYWPTDLERTGTDFSCCDFEFLAKPAPSLVLFDDHQNKIHRLQQAIQKGFQHIIFDDNLPGQATHQTFFHYMQNPDIKAWMEKIVERFEIFPPLWDTMAGMRNETFVPGLNIPRDPALACLDTTHQPRSGYTWLTYVKIKDAALRVPNVNAPTE
ncbi:MAG: hypothetical protein PHT60_02170 [Acidiphilium sp.]|nr:hypothetical protein [Acidiphilium sp.]MDD4934561.1 hypothetical protein [Acidiphilium sp.]